MLFVTGALWRIFEAWEFVQLSFVLAVKTHYLSAQTCWGWMIHFTGSTVSVYVENGEKDHMLVF